MNQNFEKFINMRLINSFLFIESAFAGNAIPKAVVDETILHRVGLGKMKGLSL